MPMSDDWRLRVDLHEDGPAHALTEHLGESVLEHDLATSFHDRVVVSREGAGVFCYTGTRRQAQEAEKLVYSLAGDLGWHVDAELTCWQPSAEKWEVPDAPRGDLECAAERGALMPDEHEEVQQRAHPEFEVRVQCASRREALQFVEKLRQEGLPCVRRYRYLLVGALDEGGAHALAQRMRQEARPGNVVITEGAAQVAWAVRLRNPFAVLRVAG